MIRHGNGDVDNSSSGRLTTQRV